jgi:hypothetical protein
MVPWPAAAGVEEADPECTCCGLLIMAMFPEAQANTLYCAQSARSFLHPFRTRRLVYEAVLRK